MKYQQDDLLIAESIINHQKEFVWYHCFDTYKQDDLVRTFPDSGGRNANVIVYKGECHILIPIPLTEDFLLVNGFEYMEYESSCGFSRDNFHCVWDRNGFTTIIRDKEIDGKIIKEHTFLHISYVHEIQKLFRLYDMEISWTLPITYKKFQ